jgi:hypothetical protein
MQGTVHIFNLANNGGSESAKAQKSRLSFMGGLGLLPSSLDDYVGSDFSFAQLHLTVPRSICSFGQANNLIIGTLSLSLCVCVCVCVVCARTRVCRVRVGRVCRPATLTTTRAYTVIGQDGTFYRYAYDSEQGGEGKREDHILFLKDKEDD